jgi:hypothetical protein
MMHNLHQLIFSLCRSSSSTYSTKFNLKMENYQGPISLGNQPIWAFAYSRTPVQAPQISKINNDQVQAPYILNIIAPHI